jgi:C-terminal processing protease CtpA/Prc
MAGCRSSTGPDGNACDNSQVKLQVQQLVQSNYFWNDMVPALDPAGFTDPQALLRALTAPARAAGLDKGFSAMVTRQDLTGVLLKAQTTGLGILLQVSGTAVFTCEVLPGSPAAGAGMGRGDQLLAVAGSQAGLSAPESQTSYLLATGTFEHAMDAGGSGSPRWLRLLPNGGSVSRDVSLAPGPVSLDPVPRYSDPIILDAGGGHRVGYLMLRVFVTPAIDLLRTAMGRFRQAGVTDLILDFRYNGGGGQDCAEKLLDLVRRDFLPGEVKFKILYNPAHSGLNGTFTFQPEPNAIRPGRIAFIVTGSTASASELVPNALVPYYGSSLALVGSRTFGKPVGQQTFINSECDWALRLVTCEARNRLDHGDYFQGLPDNGFAGVSIAASDDLGHAPGDPAEASTAAALNWIATGVDPGTPIPPPGSGAGFTAEAMHPQPNAGQLYIPGLF